jgi:thiamine-monophosphate kinase
MRISEIGEFGLIAALEQSLPSEVRGNEQLIVGIGDDAAVWRPHGAGQALIITTDSLIEGVHFRLDWTSWMSLGHKSLAVNLSDIAAMGGTPRIATITLSLTGNERVKDLQDLYRGLGKLALRTGTVIAGGDIVSSPNEFSIHITAIGETRTGRPLTRSGAKAGDAIAVSGTIGASAAGFQLLSLPPDDRKCRAATADLLITAHLEPEPRLELGRLLVRHRASSAMDLSDGLFGDLPKILQASGVRGIVEASRLPVAAAVRALFPATWLDLATRGGEDYELLFTAPPDRMAEIIEDAAQEGQPVTVIGSILPADESLPLLSLIDLDGEERAAEPGAFDHFRPVGQ